MLSQILTGIIGGLAYSLSGFANAKKKEEFSISKMLPTLIIAGVIGGFAGFTGQDYGIIAGGSMVAGLTVVIEKVFKAIKTKVF